MLRLGKEKITSPFVSLFLVKSNSSNTFAPSGQPQTKSYRDNNREKKLTASMNMYYNNEINFEAADYYERLCAIRRDLEIVIAATIWNMPHVPTNVLMDMVFLSMEDTIAFHRLEDTLHHYIDQDGNEVTEVIGAAAGVEDGEETANQDEDNGGWMEEGDDGLLTVFTIQPYEAGTMHTEHSNDDIRIIDVINIEG